MQTNEIVSLRLTRKQFKGLAQKIMEKHHKESEIRTYSLEDFQETFNNIDINKEEILEGIEEYNTREKNSSLKTDLKSYLVSSVLAASNFSVVPFSFNAYLLTGRKINLIFGAFNVVFGLYNSIRVYRNYKKCLSQDSSS